MENLTRNQKFLFFIPFFDLNLKYYRNEIEKNNSLSTGWGKIIVQFGRNNCGRLKIISLTVQIHLILFVLSNNKSWGFTKRYKTAS